MGLSTLALKFIWGFFNRNIYIYIYIYNGGLNSASPEEYFSGRVAQWTGKLNNCLTQIKRMCFQMYWINLSLNGGN